MRVSLIVAMDRDAGIGKDGGLPWRLRDDLRRFKALTMGHHLIVGRKTWESIGRPLAGRKMIVVTRQPLYRLENCPECWITNSLEAAVDLARVACENEAFVGGGAQIFDLAMLLADRIYLTEVEAATGCDVFFPKMDWSIWREIERQVVEADEHNQYRSVYRVLERAN